MYAKPFSGIFYKALPVPKCPEKPELVYFRNSQSYPVTVRLGISMWNNSWETGQFRNEVRDDDMRFPSELEFLEDKEKNVYLVPLSKRIRYHDYAPLYHLLPAKLLRKYKLPLMKCGTWPFGMSWKEELILPPDFDVKFSRAFSEYIWPLLNTRSPLYALSEHEPVRVLSHNLDHWLPYIYQVAEEWARRKPTTQPHEDFQSVYESSKKEADANNILVRPPLCGGDLWAGEEEALAAAKRMVELSDEKGRLRSVIDAIQSHRVEDDFSDKWSHQKIDFERKFYKTRAKVSFVELKDALPIHGPWSELHEDRLWSELGAVVNPKDRQVVVFLREGVTSVKEISERLGYKNHSPISKALSRIRLSAAKILG